MLTSSFEFRSRCFLTPIPRVGMTEMLGELVHGKFAELKQMQADRCPKALGAVQILARGSFRAGDSITMDGGTVFHFVTEGIEEALRRAKEAAGGRDIQVGGGASTVRQYLQARLLDEMHVAIAPILLGGGEALFAGIDLPALGYACTEHAATPGATHVVITRKA